MNSNAYIAGLVDSEGCIRIAKSPYKGKIRYQAHITIMVTDRELIDFILKHHPYGNYFFQKDGRPNKSGGFLKDRHAVRFVALKAKTFLTAIYPYLRVKKEQADLILELYKHKENRTLHNMAPVYEPLYSRIKFLKLRNAKDYDITSIQVQQSFLTEDEKSYLGGVMDGDGSIWMGSFNVISRGYIRHRTDAKIKIEMNQPESMIIAQKGFGGNITISPKQPKVFKWTKVNQTALPVLKELIQHLVLKREIAEKSINFIESKNWQQRSRALV